MRIMLAIPSHYGMVHGGALRAGLIWASEHHELQICMPSSSLLPKTFNLAWCAALHQARLGNIDLFAMLHDDIQPEKGWLDKLVAELLRTGCDVLSAVSPIKDERGITSTAIPVADPDDVWHVEKRLTMHEVHQLPETFTAADCGFPDRALLINTGCWVCRITDPRFHQVRPDGELDFCFQLHCRVLAKPEDEGCGYEIQMRSEDWEFGRWLWRNGLDARATSCVELQHFAHMGYPNNRVWGTVETEDKTKIQEEQACESD